MLVAPSVVFLQFKRFEIYNIIVYKDEPILTTAADLLEFTPPRYRQMRRIAKENRIYLETDPAIFYKQGKFMEDFQDNYEYTGEFFRYCPTYQSMSDRQLRGYFTWRTKVRQGIIERTSLSFVFVYIYELINGIGIDSPMDGYIKLKTLWEAYSPIEPKINRYLAQWLKDYVIYYNLINPYWKIYREWALIMPLPFYWTTDPMNLRRFLVP